MLQPSDFSNSCQATLKKSVNDPAFMHFNTSLFLLLSAVLLNSNIIAAQQAIRIDWERAAVLPGDEGGKPHPGLAGPFSGHSNGAILVAGGANFPNGLPWEGGTKVYHDRIYVLLQEKGHPFFWSAQSFQLANAVAYGASVQSGESVICIGGEGQQGATAQVIRLTWDPADQQVKTETLPSLPVALTNLAAAIIGTQIFVAGGESASDASDKLFCLDLRIPETGWIERKHIPRAIASAGLVPQRKNGKWYLFLLGGRTKNPGALTDFHSSVYAYDPVLDQWDAQSSLPGESAAGLAFPYKANTIFYIGGDKGDVYRNVEKRMLEIASAVDEQRKKLLLGEKNQLQVNHPGFGKRVLLFNTQTNHWDSLGVLPFAAPVTTSPFIVGQTVFIPSGEVRPGIRTPEIWIGHLKDN